MKATLIKEKEGVYSLLDSNRFISTTECKEGTLNKLSLKNCQAVANGYDLDDIVENHPLEISNYSHSCGIEQGIIYGFQKALELVEYRLSKETEFDVEIVTELAYTVNENSETEMMPEPHIKLDAEGCLILKRIV